MLRRKIPNSQAVCEAHVLARRDAAASDTIGLEHGHVRAALSQVVRCRESGDSGAHDDHALQRKTPRQPARGSARTAELSASPKRKPSRTTNAATQRPRKKWSAR